MESLSSRIRSRLTTEHVNPAELISSARSSYAARGFTEIGGPYFSDLSQRALDAMQAIYDAAFAALQEHCALSGKPSSEFATELLEILSQRLEAISRSVVPEVGGPNTSSGHQVGSRARSLIAQAKDRVGAF